MSFNILYVEDDEKTWDEVKGAVNSYSGAGTTEPMEIRRARDPEDMRDKLNPWVDLVLADVFFKDPTTHIPSDRLDDIVEYVNRWSEEYHPGRSVPIIAYTGYGDEPLKSCLRWKDRLFDIWDKNTAWPEYVAWRLSEKAKELSRIRPDKLTQRLIRDMEVGASWHKHVVDMTRRYDAGWTEFDQIRRVTKAIDDIAVKMKVQGVCGPLWSVMIDWEPLSRAISRKIRGHTRHVINVFWLGYYLLHQKDLRDIFAGYWKGLIQQRSDMNAVFDKDPLEALSCSWFYAGLFHDVGGCVEKTHKTVKYMQELLKPFGNYAPTLRLEKASEENLTSAINEWLFEFKNPLRDLIKEAVKDAAEKMEPDQGVIGAIYLREKITTGEQSCYVREAARAISLHNLFPKLNRELSALPVSWESEPLVCLLVLCDQIQTWDRERGDEVLLDKDEPSAADQPSRAELTDLRIEVKGGKPEINMAIDYIAPAHLAHSPEIYAREKDRLDKILADYPLSNLSRIQKPWPFSLRIVCSFSGDPLETVIEFE